MSKQSQREDVQAMSAAIRDLGGEIEELRPAADRLESAERIVFQEQLDALVQRKRALARRLDELRSLSEAAARRRLHGTLEGELRQLQQSVRQVSARLTQC